MTVLNRDFYPSPEGVVRKMCACLDGESEQYDQPKSRNLFILDPAAGDGRVLEHIAKIRDRYDFPHLYACEIEDELVSVIEQKGFPVQAGNFLEYQPTIKFDYIISNVPFSKAAQFVVHAWEIVDRQASGVVVFVLPKTILHEDDKFGYLANTLIQQHGVQDPNTGLPYEDLGKPFTKAERPTDVECILVKLVRKPEGEKLDFGYTNDVDTNRFKDKFSEQEMGVMPANFIGRKLATYLALLDHFAQYRLAHKKMVSLLEEFENDVEHGDSRRDHTILKSAEAQMGDGAAWNVFYEMLTEAAWNGILNHPDFQRVMTTRAKRMISEFRRSRNRMDFTEPNIRSMFMALVDKGDDLLKQCVFDAFDHMTKFYWQNKVHVEGWKSNKAYMVNTRCVLPYAIDTGFSRHWNLRYDEADQLNDIDKGLCVVMGIPVRQLNVYQCPKCKCEKIYVYSSNRDEDGGTGMDCRMVCSECKYEMPYIRSIADALSKSLEHSHSGATCFSHFFKIRYFAKGTVHLYFRDMEVWQKFNCTASRLRGWLPDDTSYERLKIRRKPKASQTEKAKYAGFQPAYDPDGERVADDVVVEIAPKLCNPTKDAGIQIQTGLFDDEAALAQLEEAADVVTG